MSLADDALAFGFSRMLAMDGEAHDIALDSQEGVPALVDDLGEGSPPSDAFASVATDRARWARFGVMASGLTVEPALGQVIGYDGREWTVRHVDPVGGPPPVAFDILASADARGRFGR